MASKAPFHFSPLSLDDLKQVIQLAKKRRKVISITSKKKPEELGKSSVFYVNMEHFNKVIEINVTEQCVIVESSAQVRLIKSFLEKVGLALCIPGLPDDKTIASAFSSGFYSPSMTLEIISSYVTSIDVLTADNHIITLTPDDNRFRAVACGLGACGIILLVTLKCEPTYHLKTIQFGCSYDKLIGNLPFNLKKFPNLSIFWWPHTNNAIVSNTDKVYGLQNRATKIEQLTNLINRNFDKTSLFLLTIFYWFCLFFPFLIPLVHYGCFWLLFVWQKVLYFSSHQTILPANLYNTTLKTSEWFIPIRKTITALKLIEKWCNSSSHFLNYVMHIHFIKKDSAYLSPANESDVCCISVNINQPFGFYFPYERAFSEFGELMKSIGGKPKLNQNFNMKNDDLDAMFPLYEEWFLVRKELDPRNLFINYLEE